MADFSWPPVSGLVVLADVPLVVGSGTPSTVPGILATDRVISVVLYTPQGNQPIAANGQVIRGFQDPPADGQLIMYYDDFTEGSGFFVRITVFRG